LSLTAECGLTVECANANGEIRNQKSEIMKSWKKDKGQREKEDNEKGKM